MQLVRAYSTLPAPRTLLSVPFLTLVLALTLPVAATAQERAVQDTAQKKVLKLDAVTVTATRSLKSVFETPKPVAVIDRAKIRAMTPNNVSDLFSPFINTYALIFLVGDAALSAVRFSRKKATYHRFAGNALIALGALLPGIGGMATRIGHVEVLYLGEFFGIILIWLGYRFNVRGREFRKTKVIAMLAEDAAPS